MYIYIYICVCNHEKFALPVTTTMALCQVNELPQSHCGDNREGTLFS